jgi:hypothetical protein
MMWQNLVFLVSKVKKKKCRFFFFFLIFFYYYFLIHLRENLLRREQVVNISQASFRRAPVSAKAARRTSLPSNILSARISHCLAQIFMVLGTIYILGTAQNCI